jgi:hypothetical protein
MILDETRPNLRRTCESILSGEIEFEGKKKNFKDNKHFSNPLEKYYVSDQCEYNRDQMIKTLVEEDGLEILIGDLKAWKYNHGPRPFYANRCFEDIIFASALPKALSSKFKGKKKDDYDDILETGLLDKKDINIILDEILFLLNHKIKDERFIKKYSQESRDSIIKAYTNILYKYSKKKLKKFKGIGDMGESAAKQLVVLTAGENPYNSIYNLLNFLYRETDNPSSEICQLNNKNILKIFKISYGKNNMKNVLKYLMLERSRNKDRMSKNVVDLWVVIDEILRDGLEDLDKKDIIKVIESYVNDRKKQETSGRIKRRLGDRRSIFSEDYPKLTKAFESIEKKNPNFIEYLR